MVPYKRSLTRVRSLSSLLPPPILYHHTRTLPPFPTTLYTTKVFAVLSGTHFNSGCCFDYGNSEVNDKDDGPGTMEAIYFGNAHWRGNTGAGDTGPWVGADLEQGMYVEERRWRSVDLLMPCMCVCVCRTCVSLVCARMSVCVCARAHVCCRGGKALILIQGPCPCLSSFHFRYYGGGNVTKINLDNKPLAFEFVTTSVKGRTDGFTIKGGDATKGTLATMYVCGERGVKRGWMVCGIIRGRSYMFQI